MNILDIEVPMTTSRALSDSDINKSLPGMAGVESLADVRLRVGALARRAIWLPIRGCGKAFR
jgi:hypothetical protein